MQPPAFALSFYFEVKSLLKISSSGVYYSLPHC